MAVEARHVDLNPFAKRSMRSRELMMMNSVGGGGIGDAMGYGVMGQLSGTSTATDVSVQIYGGGKFVETAGVRSGSSLTCAVPAASSRKRARQAAEPVPVSSLETGGMDQSFINRCGGLFTFLGEDFSFQLQQQQLEMDRFIVQHTEKVRMEIESRRKRSSRRIAAAMEENVVKKLRAKQEQIEKIGKLNWQLEARVKSLYEENQIWKDLAQSNAATANALRCNLAQVLAQKIQDENHHQNTEEDHRRGTDANTADDAQSICGSSSPDIPSACTAEHKSNLNNRACRNCWQHESCVLLLPCRHLCLCTACGSSLHTCPACNSIKTASVHVNLSAS